RCATATRSRSTTRDGSTPAPTRTRAPTPSSACRSGWRTSAYSGESLPWTGSGGRHGSPTRICDNQRARFTSWSTILPENHDALFGIVLWFLAGTEPSGPGGRSFLYFWTRQSWRPAWRLRLLVRETQEDRMSRIPFVLAAVVATALALSAQAQSPTEKSSKSEPSTTTKVENWTNQKREAARGGGKGGRAEGQGQVGRLQSNRDGEASDGPQELVFHL